MNSNLENRNKARFDHESVVTLENNKIGIQRNARMYNFSDFGLYIETDHLLEPQTEIHIGIANSPFSLEPDEYESYRTDIRWRKPLVRAAYYYGYGVKIIEKENFVIKNEDQYAGSRQHSRVEYAIPVKYESDNQVYQGSTQNVSSGGVFIKTRDPVAVGQKVTINIPLKKKEKSEDLPEKSPGRPAAVLGLSLSDRNNPSLGKKILPKSQQTLDILHSGIKL